MGRSILAVIAGYLSATIAVVILDFIWGMVLPPTAFYAANLIAAAPCAILGGYVAGWVAKRAEVKHAAGVAGIALVFWTIVFVMTLAAPRILGQNAQPLWYQITLILILVPAMLLGGHLRARQVRTARP